MTDQHRSRCPINLSLELIGDRWSLIILRDMIFGQKRHFRELLTQSMEGISSNILSDRLKMLVDNGMLTKSDDPSHKQKTIYSLTEMSIRLVPVLAHLGAWGRRYLPVSPELSIRARLLEEGGPKLWEQFMEELRVQHLGKRPKPRAITVAQQLQAAFEKEQKRRRRRQG